MTCEHVQELLADYLEGRLEPELQPQVRLHLTQCPDCREELEAEKALCQWLGARKVIPVSPQFSRNLMSRLGVAVPKPPRWFESLLELSNYWAPTLAALLVVVFAGRTLLGWIDQIRLFGHQAVLAVDNLPSSTNISHILPGSISSSFPLGSLLILVAIGAVTFGIIRLLKN